MPLLDGQQWEAWGLGPALPPLAEGSLAYWSPPCSGPAEGPWGCGKRRLGAGL